MYIEQQSVYTSLETENEFNARVAVLHSEKNLGTLSGILATEADLNVIVFLFITTNAFL